MAEEGHKVSLNVYDLSQGLARQLSMTFLGKAIEGIWHTGMVVYGNEYYFGGGIQHAPAGTTPYGTPIRVVDLGVTHVPKNVFEMYLQEISPRYTAETYNLFTHNCNNFSNELAQFLVGASIPDYILKLPNEVKSSPVGALIMPMMQQFESTLRAGAVPKAPQFKPPILAATSQATSSTHKSTGSNCRSSGERKKEVESKAKLEEQAACSGVSKTSKTMAAPPAVKPAGAQQNLSGHVVAGDPLAEARSKVEEEIKKEFAAIMATGTLRASEAAAIATRRVMQRYRRTNIAQS